MLLVPGNLEIWETVINWLYWSITNLIGAMIEVIVGYGKVSNPSLIVSILFFFPCFGLNLSSYSK